jgi:hypothetical protein
MASNMSAVKTTNRRSESVTPWDSILSRPKTWLWPSNPIGQAASAWTCMTASIWMLIHPHSIHLEPLDQNVYIHQVKGWARIKEDQSNLFPLAWPCSLYHDSHAPCRTAGGLWNPEAMVFSWYDAPIFSGASPAVSGPRPQVSSTPLVTSILNWIQLCLFNQINYVSVLYASFRFGQN